MGAKLHHGQIIYVNRKLGGIIPYKHFGVYMGNKKVIHFASENPDSNDEPRIREATLNRFLAENSAELKKMNAGEDKAFYIVNFGQGYSKKYKNELMQRGEWKKIYENDTDSLEAAINTLNLAREYPKFRNFCDNDVVKRAKKCIDANSYDEKTNSYVYVSSGYNVFSNNCEHFAFWCKTNLHLSKQSNNWITHFFGKNYVEQKIYLSEV